MMPFMKAFLVAALLAFPAQAAEPRESARLEFVEGNPQAKVTVIEYASLTCHYCGAFHAKGYPRLKAEYIDTGKVRFVLRDLPSDAQAMGATLLMRCAPAPHQRAMMDKLLTHQHDWMHADKPIDVLTGYAKDIAGMTPGQVSACLANKDLLRRIEDGRQEGFRVHRLEVTPSFLVGDGTNAWHTVAGDDYPALKDAIDAALK